MDNFSVIYKILKTLEKAMDYDEIEIESISADTLGITENRWLAIMEMLISDGLVTGVKITNYLSNKRLVNSDMRITLKGLEYLQDNTLMKKAHNIAKGIVELIP